MTLSLSATRSNLLARTIVLGFERGLETVAVVIPRRDDASHGVAPNDDADKLILTDPAKYFAEARALVRDQIKAEMARGR